MAKGSTPGSGSDSEDDSSSEELQWLLGFVEPPAKPAALLRHRFPSKVGGRPAWLHPTHLPSREQLLCKVTGRPLSFLLQVYAPIDDNPNAFHRAVFVFVSPQGDQLSKAGAVRVYRCQLPRRNDYYSYKPAQKADVVPHEPQAQGDPPVDDPWGVVEAEAAVGRGELPAEVSGRAVFPEHELVVEPETEEKGTDAAGVARLLQQYEAMRTSEGELGDADLPAEVLSSVEENMTEERKHFAHFAAVVAREPEQVLRYCVEEGAQPLWPNPAPIPMPADIPACERCGAPRRFEFEVMPQLLNHLGLNHEDPAALDWGAIAVFTCSSSCNANVDGSSEAAASSTSAYLEEFVWVQGP
ncbi:hypothetical protein WJX72_003204 [[Myrmecia] bisecta]|uniref:Programmed cell death protein 2 C-terminal domain-containing protein n=1 Tax=[Myrmecia] bisecta TaxID=41462 RepID=A0AAW1QEK8_9CHLO